MPDKQRQENPAAAVHLRGGGRAARRGLRGQRLRRRHRGRGFSENQAAERGVRAEQGPGGSRPGPPTGRLLPITLGQVFQRIDVVSSDFDNIVELELGAPWPLPPVELTATLAHKFELTGTASIKIDFDKTTVKTTGNLSQLPPLEVPRIPDGLRPPASNTGSGEFEVTYLDDDTRVTRGDRGELRVFVIS